MDVSPYMAPKQMEMDRIVHQIYSAIETQPHLQSTLLVLCGDHGMNEAGNHGGSATGETSTALLFISPSFNKHFSGSPCPGEPSGDYNYYETVEQSDIAPTLAALLGFPIPLNNLGVFIPNFLDLWKDGKSIQPSLLNPRLTFLRQEKGGHHTCQCPSSSRHSSRHIY